MHIQRFDEQQQPDAEWSSGKPILDAVAAPPDHVPLRRGSVEVDRSGDDDVVTVRSGALSVQIVMTEAGPRLELRGAEVSIAASQRLALTGREVSLHATDRLEISCDGDVAARVRGDRHTHIQGSERLEAATLEVQANDGDVAFRARNDVRIDGDHVHLNGLDTPSPFPWSAPAHEPPSEENPTPEASR